MHLYNDAISDYTFAINKKNDYWQAYNNRAICEIGNKNYISAINDLTKTIELNPDIPSAYYLRGVAKTESGKDGCNDFIIAYQRGFANAKAAITEYCNN